RLACRQARDPAGLRRRAMTETQLSRRAFLSTSGALVVTLVAPADWADAATSGVTTRPALKGDQLSSYITIDPDGTVVAYYGKIDGGQGLGPALAQFVGEGVGVT